MLRRTSDTMIVKVYDMRRLSVRDPERLYEMITSFGITPVTHCINDHMKVYQFYEMIGHSFRCDPNDIELYVRGPYIHCSKVPLNENHDKELVDHRVHHTFGEYTFLFTWLNGQNRSETRTITNENNTPSNVSASRIEDPPLHTTFSLPPPLFPALACCINKNKISVGCSSTTAHTGTLLESAVDKMLLKMKENCHDSFQCPVCLTYMTGHIMQCVIGHSVCATCQEKLKSCPVCKKEFLSTRNFSLENIVQNISVLCENYEVGCKETVFLKDKEKHEKCCPYRRYECLSGIKFGCTWQGRKNEIFEHVSKNHLLRAFRLKGQSTVQHRYFNQEKDLSTNRIILAHGELFWFQSFFNPFAKILYQSVHYIGLAQNCSTFIYKLHFTSSTNKNKELLFSMETHPDTVELKDLIENETECFSIKWNLAKHFIQNDYINFKLEIVKVS